FPNPDRFDPHRFVGTRPPTFAWVPFGGGTRRCIGATFANTEMDVVLRTVLRHFTLDATTDPGEKGHSRGVAYTPKKGGRIVRQRRERVTTSGRPAAAASNPAGCSDTCSRWDSAAGSPDAPAPPPRNHWPG